MTAPSKRNSTREQGNRFGGRSTAAGVGYEARVAADIAVKMLGGSCCIVWEGINGDDIVAITMQDTQPVDDIVVTLKGDHQRKVFISAKKRTAKILLTAKSPAFTGVIDSFVKQFLQLALTSKEGNRFMWAVPSSAGAAMTQNLLKVLNTFRKDDCESVAEFLRRRQVSERQALDALITQTKSAWKSQTKKNPTEAELIEFLRMVDVSVFDFEVGLNHEQAAQETIRCSVAENPHESRKIWRNLELHFNDANQRGGRTTPASLRRMLVAEGFKLKTTPDFSADVDFLRQLTVENLARLKDHTLLRFSNSEIHIERNEDLSAMVSAATRGDLLVTGEPGCGKSGLIQLLAEALRSKGIPVVLLLAEEIFSRDGKDSASLPGLSHKLDDVLASWPDGAKGILITDALDAVREVDIQKKLRRLLQAVQRGVSGWTVVASVREFDLKYGCELRESFPGEGVAGHCSSEFDGVSHFHVGGLSEANLDELITKAPEIAPFITKARANPRADNIHKSPFFLRLAADLLRNGITPLRLTDWSSPAILLKKFWEKRVQSGSAASSCLLALKTICTQMVKLRSMALAIQEVELNSPDLDAIIELRSRGILQSPILKNGSPTGEDELRFSHHLLHDYAIARLLIPPISTRFTSFTATEPLLPVFYRQSFLFALEGLWDGTEGRDGFWKVALQMESAPQLHGITRIIAPVLAARRVDTPADLSPLLAAVQSATNEDSPAEKALRHLASGLQDAGNDTICAGASAWCPFVTNLALLLPHRPSLEAPIVHILTKLNVVLDSFGHYQLLSLNEAARAVLAHHVAKEVAKGWAYAARTSIATLCKTFSVAIPESEAALLLLLTPQRLSGFPHNDLRELAHNLTYLGDSGDSVVRSLFIAAFSSEPKHGQWENTGGMILSLRMQSSDQWNSIHYTLAEYYEGKSGSNVGLMTDLACIAWNATARRRNELRDSDDNVLAKVHFRGLECELIQDGGHMLERTYEVEENRILSHFETLLDQWITSGDIDRMHHALDYFVARNRTSMMWGIFLEAGAKYPDTLGRELESVLDEPTFLTNPDYSYGGVLLFAALHRVGDLSQRERLENLILDLPKKAQLRHDEPREPIPSWLRYAQGKLLGSLDEPNLVLPATRGLWKKSAEERPFPMNHEPHGFHRYPNHLLNEDLIERRGNNLKDPVDAELAKLVEALKPFRELENSKLDVAKIERNWALIGKCERSVHQHRNRHRETAHELWGHLVAACEVLPSLVDWPKTSKRWEAVRRILLKASTDPIPQTSRDEDLKEVEFPCWGWPAPRLDAARGLLFLIRRIGHSDRSTSAALLRLSRDKSYSLRFNMSERLALIEQADPELMWRLIDRFIRYERKFSVLNGVVQSLDHLWTKAPDEVKSRMARIVERLRRDQQGKHSIHKSLAHTHLFQFLRTGDPDCEAYIKLLINECDSERSSSALADQFHTLRVGRWLTAGNAVEIIEFQESVRSRAWSFLEKLVSVAQEKLRNHRSRWQQLHSTKNPDIEKLTLAQDGINRTTSLLDGIAMQLYFASGALADKRNNSIESLSEPQLRRYWAEAAKLLQALSNEIHPHTANQLVETFHHLLPCAPNEVFLAATNAIISSSTAGYQHESLAVKEVVNLIQRALADHREIFQSTDGNESDCLVSLLKVLDLFVEAGWPKARQLTHRLEEMYR